MSAAVLREAAELMRDRAEAATKYPWAANEPGTKWRHYDGQVRAVGFPDGFDDLICDVLDNDDAQHIASWHPVVALAVADWLEDVATVHDDPYYRENRDDLMRPALAVARAYLGGDR